MSLGSIFESSGTFLATAGTQAPSKASPGHETPARPYVLTTDQAGILPSGDPVTDHQQLQRFIDNVATDGILGLIEAGHWYINRKLVLHDGIRLAGRGMKRSIIEARTEDWRQDRFTMMDLEVGHSLNENGAFLSDFTLIGADKHATDKGGLLILEGLSNFLVERVQSVDASSYGIFVTGYGVGRFTNDIRSSFWNSTHRGMIRQCRAVRGQIGIGCEGGAQNLLIMGNHTDGQALHGFRLASAYDTQLIANSAINTRNAYWIDRHRGIHVLHNTATGVERGCVYGGFHQDKDEEISRGLWIVGNSFNTTKSSITDAYQGKPYKFTHSVKIKDNLLQGGNVRLLWSKNVDVQGNDGDGGNAIITSHEVSGRIGNNTMKLLNRADNVEDLGGNVSLQDPV
ncbi:MAG: hypothetical protein ACQEUN_03820 [Pseudomonadota bacterium]